MTRQEGMGGFYGAWAAVKVFACPTESFATGGTLETSQKDVRRLGLLSPW